MKAIMVALYPFQPCGMDGWIDHGAGYTYTAVKSSGGHIDFLDMHDCGNFDEVQARLMDYDLVCFGLKSSYYGMAMEIIKRAKINGSKVLIGGYHVTAAKEELLENPDIDWVMKGESEITFPQFLKDPESFPRYFEGEKPKCLDSLPFIDRSVFKNPVESVDFWHRRMVSVMTSRGCPYRCGFCQPLEKNHFGLAIRRRSVDRTIEELLHLKEKYNPQCVFIHDDTFLMHRTWIEEFIEKYPQVGLPFWAAGRADGICKNEDLVKRLIEVGWALTSVGFESGSQRILDLIKKGTTVEQNLEAAKIIKMHGGRIFANYMFGLPWETKEDIDATVDMVEKIRADVVAWSFFSPYKGNELGEQCIKEDLSLLDRYSYNRNPDKPKCKNVDYDYILKSIRGKL
jgi:radical SAM superfamily enzyme YgiQ (UPF0313 family)